MKALHGSKLHSDASVAIVFGAGASTPDLPSQADLLKGLAANGEQKFIPATHYLKRTFPGLSAGNLRFEEAVAPLEIAEADAYWFHFAGRREDSPGYLITNREVLETLDAWLAEALDPERLRPPKRRKTADYTERLQAYRSLCGNLPYSRLLTLLGARFGLQKIALLSMNYDILLDRCLYQTNQWTPAYRVEGFAEPRDGNVTLLKLHGSLNWRICENCHILRDLGEYVVWPHSQCNDCGMTAARPMLIRPTLLKDFRHRVWQDTWRQAGHTLAGASEWVFVGYSLPMADVWMLKLLAQSLRSGGTPKRRIVVVNPDPDIEKRFRLLFPNLSFHADTFAHWLDVKESGGW